MNMNLPETADVVVIGAGLVGGAITYALAKRRVKVVLVERSCPAAEASGGNFGLIWVQSKSPAWYLKLTMAAAQSYPDYLAELDGSGVDIEYRREGAWDLILTQAALEARQRNLAWQREIPGYQAEIMPPQEVHALEPAIAASALVAGVYSAMDGDLNPFALCRVLVGAARRHGAVCCFGGEVIGIKTVRRRITKVVTAKGEIATDTVINAAGLGVNHILVMAGADALPVVGNRGQVIVTEPFPRLLARPTNIIRQTVNGNVLLGCTTEPGSSDRQGKLDDVHVLAARSIKVIPALANANCIRTWSSPRVWPVDGLPIFEQTESLWSMYTIATHSAVSLNPFIGETVAEWLTQGKVPPIELRLNENRRKPAG